MTTTATKKVFISVPMRNRTKEEIEHTIELLKDYATQELDYNLEFIHTIIEDEPPKDVDQRMWYLGRSIQLLSQADYLVTIPNIPIANHGCYIEKEVFQLYKSPDKILVYGRD